MAALGYRCSAAQRGRRIRPRGNAGRDWQHGLSLFGELKYPPGFKHFDYVNPGAPKGGAVRMVAFGTFDNFNEVVSGLKGSIAMGVGMISDTLRCHRSTRSRPTMG